MKKSKVAVLKTSPATVMNDYQRLAEMAGYEGFPRSVAPDDIKRQYIMAFHDACGKYDAVAA